MASDGHNTLNTLTVHVITELDKICVYVGATRSDREMKIYIKRAQKDAAEVFRKQRATNSNALAFEDKRVRRSRSLGQLCSHSSARHTMRLELEVLNSSPYETTLHLMSRGIQQMFVAFLSLSRSV